MSAVCEEVFFLLETKKIKAGPAVGARVSGAAGTVVIYLNICFCLACCLSSLEDV